MNKAVLIPKLTIGGIKKNGSCYIPYFLVTVFSIFTFFVFSAIIDNPIMMTLPRAAYVWGLMQIGRVLLVIILAPVLVSTNQFLMKQRKNELGLYNVLGLDRKYIGLMMLIEGVIIYAVTMIVGIVLGIVLSKLIFLLLLKISGIPVQAEFTISGGSIYITAIYFGVVALFNLIVSLFQVGKAKPIELMKENKKGEKQVRGLKLKSLFGFLFLGAGYYLALHTELDSMIFTKFFFDVLLVVLGTRFLFSAGSITILNKLKKTNAVYYRKENFVTISGMLYRMKRNAQSLANICIFSTMIIITLIFTVTLGVGKEDAVTFNYPLDVTYSFQKDAFKDYDGFAYKLSEAADKSGVTIENEHRLIFKKVEANKENVDFTLRSLQDEDRDAYILKLITLEDYNACEGQQQTLADDEILVFGPNEDLDQNEVTIGSRKFHVKEELKSFSFENKENRGISGALFYVVVKDEATVDELAKSLDNGKEQAGIDITGFDLKGTKAQKLQFIETMNNWCKQQTGFNSYDYIGDWREESEPMVGGLLFLGIFFGIVFTVCMVLMMYYKQLSEGYEDQRSFRIFKQVGMSDKEIRGTIKRQILLVFFIPLAMAILHTFMALYVVNNLLSVIYLFNRQQTLICSLAVMLIFAGVYVLAYQMTSRAYYRIVR